MNHENLPVPRRSLEAVQQEFQTWRSGRQRGSRIPERLWQAAAELSRRHSMSEIARRLRLDYVKLSRRIASLPSAGPDEIGAGCGFAELGLLPGTSSAGGCAGSGPTSGECLVEVEDGTGRRLKMHMRGASGSEAVEIARVLWETRR